MARPRGARPTAVAAALVALGIAGCASVPYVNIEKGASRHIEKVMLLEVARPPPPKVVNASGGALFLFGVAGALVQHAIDVGHSGTYADAVGARTAALAPAMTAAMVRALEKGGYHVIRATNAPVLADGDDNVDLSSVRTDADAILAVWFTRVMYLVPHTETKYEPWLVVKVKMVDAASRRDLYFKTFSAGWEMDVTNAVHVPGGMWCRYPSFDELMAHAIESVEGFAESTRNVAEKVGSDLVRE